jgi:hypothetical protein
MSTFEVPVSHLHQNRFSTSAFLPIAEEKQKELDSLDGSRILANELKGRSLLSPRILLQYLSDTMLNPPSLRPNDARRTSIASSSSSRSGYEGGAALKTPTISSVGALASERESMQTPRPLSQQEHDTPTPQPAAFLHKHGKDSSEQTLGPRDGIAPEYIIDDKPKMSSEYASNSIGRSSLSSAGHGGRQSVSEYGERPTTSSSVRKARKKTVAPPELLVIVRPPPSKQVNPLNLQIQLVIPQLQSNAPTSRASLDSSRDDASMTASVSSYSNGMASSGSNTTNNANNALPAPATPTSAKPLTRSSSINSSRSARSDLSSGAFSSTSSSNNANRRVTPLYNLNFHNITATTVTDAGTDEKVAKFGKKGVDIDGFGQLEPHELLLGVNDLATLTSRRLSSTRAPTTSATLVSNNSGSDFTSPETTSVASRAQGVPAARMSGEEPPTSFDAMSPEAKNPSDGGLGGKFLSKFKKFSMGAGQNIGGKLGSIGAPTASANRNSMTLNDASSSLLAKITSSAASKGGDVGDDRNTVPVGRVDSVSGAYSLGQTLGIEVPQLVAGGGLRSDGKRTEGYYWTVRKWNRRSAVDEEEDRDRRFEGPGSNPVLKSVWKRFNMVNRMGGQEIHPHCSVVPVRFEWTRNKERRKSSVVSSGHAKAATTDGATRSRASRMSFSRASMDVKGGSGEATTDSAADSFRNNLRPPKSGQTSRPSSIHSNSSARYRKSLDAGSQAGSQVGSAEIQEEDSDPEDSEVTWSCHLVLGPTTRIPIGSLSPTPHHPKLIGQLSIPFPLPDLSQSGIGADGAGLTREELKDIISITCLFVVVREGFGGLVKRKRVQGSK